jgi:hypothetical protein
VDAEEGRPLAMCFVVELDAVDAQLRHIPSVGLLNTLRKPSLQGGFATPKA